MGYFRPRWLPDLAIRNRQVRPSVAHLLYTEFNRMSRREALGLYTVGSSWFSGEDGKKGTIATGRLADLAVLSEDYFSTPEERIKQLESVLTLVGGKAVYATAEFKHLDPPPLPVSPDWSPVKYYRGYAGTVGASSALVHRSHPLAS